MLQGWGSLSANYANRQTQPQRHTHTHSHLRLSACSCDAPFYWHFNPKAEIMQHALHLWPLPICLAHHPLHHCYLSPPPNPQCHLSAVVSLSWVNKSPAGILKQTHSRTLITAQSKKRQEGNWKTHKVMPESEGKWAAGVLTGRLLSGVSLPAHSFWMHECKAVGKWSAAVQRVEAEVQINQDKLKHGEGTVACLVILIRSECLTEVMRVFLQKGNLLCWHSRAVLSARRRPAHITVRNGYKEFGIIKAAKAA